MPWPNEHHTATIIGCKGYLANGTMQDIWPRLARRSVLVGWSLASRRKRLPFSQESIEVTWAASKEASAI